MSNLPRANPLRQQRQPRGLPARGVRGVKLAEGELDAAKLQGVPVAGGTAAEGSTFQVIGGQVQGVPLSAIPAQAHDVHSGAHSNALRVTAGGGLVVTFEAGRARIDQTVYDIVSGSLTLADSATNYVFVNSSGIVASNTTSFPANSIPLAQATTSGGVITSVIDKRCFFYEDAGGGTTDADAIHDNVAGEIAAIAEKVTPIAADLLVIEDSAAGNIKKRVQVGNLPGGGAPTTADYLVGTAQAGLSAEIVVGTTPGGELGGSWASPTVDATHSGSAHHAQAHDVDGADHTDKSTIASTWTLIAGGIFKCTSGATPSGEIVPQVKTTTGAPTHSASEGTMLWNSVDNKFYVNNNGTTGWTEIGAGGGAAHAILDGGTAHTDSNADTVSRGSLITGQGVTPKWDELVVGAAGDNLYSDGTDASWLHPTVYNLPIPGGTPATGSAVTIINRLPIIRAGTITRYRVYSWTNQGPTSANLVLEVQYFDSPSDTVANWTETLTLNAASNDTGDTALGGGTRLLAAGGYFNLRVATGNGTAVNIGVMLYDQ